MVKMSVVTAMLLSSGAYAAQIVGADANESRTDNIQFGFGGLNLENVTVNLSTGDDFNVTDGSYTPMALGDTYESSVFSSDDDKLDESTRLGYVTQKIWPISEPTGIKVINNDGDVNQYKPTNCIIASSYQGDSNTSDSDDRTYYLDSDTPKPVICSSYSGSSKRFQLVLNENIMDEINTTTGYGKSIDLVFNINSSVGEHRYQVFQKVSNFTGMRLDGLKVEVLNADGLVDSNLTISLGLGEADGGNIFGADEMAFYPPGLWGDGTKDHLPKGWFDTKSAGYLVDGNGTNTITTTNNNSPVDGNYEALFGNWIPDKWVAWGMHEEFDPTQEPALLAYWGTTPGDVNATPAWYYGMYNNDEEHTNFAPVPDTVIAQWAANMKTDDNPDGKYVIDDIEDLPNLSLNYIVNVGAGIDNNFTIRFTPKVSEDQTPPSYFEADGVTRILPTLPSTDDGTTSSGGGGGGCTFNPDSKNFDMTFLMLMALGLLYPFRRRFLK